MNTYRFTAYIGLLFVGKLNAASVRKYDIGIHKKIVNVSISFVIIIKELKYNTFVYPSN